MVAMPSVAIVKEKGLVFLTCSEHSGGTKMQHFHMPRVPCSLPAATGDQLAHAVL